MEGRTKLSDLRDLSIEDLIGRHPVDTEVESIADYVAGKRVLVTGAGGSIGSELCRQISKYAPTELIMLDRDETGLQMAQLVPSDTDCFTPVTWSWRISASPRLLSGSSKTVSPRWSTTQPH